MVTLAEALALGTRHHQAGELAQAEHIYRQILAAEPEHPDALHQLGMLALHARHFEAAVELIGRAVKANRSNPVYLLNLAESLRHLGRHDEVIANTTTALRLQPGWPQALRVQGMSLAAKKQHAEAAEAFRQVLRAQSEDTQARTQLGYALLELGKHGEAAACFARVARIEPDSADAHFNLATALEADRKLDAAIESYQTALRLAPGHVEAHNNLGNILKDHRAYDEAIAHYRAAVAARPNFVPALTNLGTLLLGIGSHAEAETHLRTALAIEPATTVAWDGLGQVLDAQGRLDEAVAAFEELLRLEPNHVGAHLNLGNIYRQRGKIETAVRYCEAALRIKPDMAEAYSNMGVAYNDHGFRDQAVENLQRAIELKPNLAVAHCNLAVALDGLGRLAESYEHRVRGVELAPDFADYHSNLLYHLLYESRFDAAAVFAEHRVWGARHADPLSQKASPHTNDRTPDRRLRLGYVSPHFHSHAVNFFSEPILASHDHTQFEVFCYSDIRSPDATTDRLRGYADHWFDAVGTSDRHLAERIRADQIDILVDLTGHISGGARLLTFARRPAPVQVTYIGYQTTTGMLAMDYRLTDDYADPPGLTDEFHTEELVRLPTTFFVYLPSDYAPAVTPPPAEKNDFVTFGSINNFVKVGPEVLQTWAKLLARVPNSKLLIRADMTDWLEAYLKQTFAAEGIADDRLILVNRLPRREYLDMINRIDIALDPFPMNGHTTTCDCLWQGVPVVTLSGQTYASRFGGSGLVTLGLTDWIATSREQYLDICAAKASDIPSLAKLRAALRPRMAASPLLDFVTFARNLEAEYRKMWRKWCGT